MQGIALSEPEPMTVVELRRSPDLASGDRQDIEALRNQLVEHRQGGRALRQIDLPGRPLDRHRGGHRGDGLVADQKLRRS